MDINEINELIKSKDFGEFMGEAFGKWAQKKEEERQKEEQKRKIYEQESLSHPSSERISDSIEDNNGYHSKYIDDLLESEKQGIRAFEIFKARFPIDEILELMNYDYSTINVRNKDKVIKQLLNEYRRENGERLW